MLQSPHYKPSLHTRLSTQLVFQSTSYSSPSSTSQEKIPLAKGSKGVLPYFSQWQDTKGGWFHLEEALLSFMWSKEVHPKIFISEFFFPRKGGLCKIPVVNTNSCNEETQGSVQFCTYSTPLSSRAKVLGDQRSQSRELGSTLNKIW